MPRNTSGIFYNLPGTEGFPDTTIESPKYNNYIADVADDLNRPRPITAGGTGATSAPQAMGALEGEIAYQYVSNFDTQIWRPGSFFAPATATGSPVAGHAFCGWCYTSDLKPVAPDYVPTNQNIIVHARDIYDPYNSARTFVRKKTANVWSPWVIDGRTVSGDFDGVSGTAADMFYGLYGTAPTSYFVVNSKADLTGQNLFSVSKATSGTSSYGNFTVDRSSAPADNAAIFLNKSENASLISGQKNGVPRWQVIAGNGTAETGGSAGSDFSIDRFTDAGGFAGRPLLITRSNGDVTWTTPSFYISGTLNINGAASFASTLNVTGGVDVAGPITGRGIASLNAGGPTQGIYYFGNTGSKTLSYDGTNYALAGGNFYVGGDVTASRPATPTIGAYYFGNTTTKYIYFDGTNFVFGGGHVITPASFDIRAGADVWAGSGVYRFINNASGKAFYLDGPDYRLIGGNLIVAGSITATLNTIYANSFSSNTGGNYSVDTASFTSSGGAAAGFTTLTVNGNCYFDYEKAAGTYRWVVNGAAGMYLTIGGNLTVVTNASKPGGGAWADSSDIRIKNVTGEYKAGLDEVAQLRPVTFTFKGNDTPSVPANITSSEDDPKSKEAVVVPYPNSPHYQAAKDQKRFSGLIAQEVEKIFPEMVKKREAYIDSNKVTDLLDLDTTPLIYALVNAVKELKARVEQLEAAP